MEKYNVDKARKMAVKAAEEWWAEKGSEEAIRNTVREIIDRAVYDIVMQLIGFEIDPWTKRFKISNRDESSNWMKYIRKVGNELIEQWIKEQIGNLPQLTAKDKKEVQKEFASRVKRHTIDRLHKEAECQIAEEVNKLVNEVLDNIREG